MKKTVISVFTFCMVAACNNASQDTTQTTDSSNSANTKMGVDSGSKMQDSGAMSNTNTTSTVTPDAGSAAFFPKAADGGMTEVQLGQLAQQKGINQSVRDFGAMMVSDHSAANDKLKALATQRNVTLPAAIGATNQKLYDDLNKKSGKDFDKDYINDMVKDHQEDIKEFEDAEKKVTDTDVKSFIANTLPTLKVHLDSARAIQKRLK